MNRIGHLFGRALRETGQAIDRLGLRVVNSELYRETYSRHRPIMTLFDKVGLVVESIQTRAAYNYSHYVHFLYSTSAPVLPLSLTLPPVLPSLARS